MSGSDLCIMYAWPRYLQNRIVMLCLLISTFMYLRAIYMFPGSVCLFCYSQTGRLILGIYIHCKNRLAVFPPPAGMSLTKLSLAGKYFNYSRPGRVWSVTSRLGTGNLLTFFIVYISLTDTYMNEEIGNDPTQFHFYISKNT
jgi:hypothetical protein